MVDAETKQPLEGVVVLGVWYKRQLTVAGPTGSFYDSIEVLTDKNGAFKISGQGVLLFSNLNGIDLTVFKAGYEMLEASWTGFKTRTGKMSAQWDGNHPTFLLKKLSLEERRQNIPARPGIEQKRQHLLTDEINKVRAEFGYNPL